ncbi:MAG: DUF3473 domain-containing protein [Ignavibacteria bacterium]|nr:DUF3473 domain-containing protein [Ignavibacteria bacterium]MBI3765113.1 DUF3473 domain-containing protein [Ignavibacteriales bacterium]
MQPILNAMSVDLEAWFCAYNLSQVIRRADWDKCELRVYENTTRILTLLERYKVKATFFVLGWIAERIPELIRDIDRRQHEIAVHGYDHILLTQTTPSEFEEDLNKTLALLKRIGVRQQIVGFRAPSFTLVKNTRWVLEILEKYQFKYDSSVFPVGFHPDYGMPDAPLDPYQITPGLMEFPISCIEVFGKRVPCGGGGYFRIFPYAYSKQCIKRCNAEGRSAVFYIHPWELDPDQPRLNLPWIRKFRHYYGLNSTERKLDRLLQDFQFTTIRDILAL